MKSKRLLSLAITLLFATVAMSTFSLIVGAAEVLPSDVFYENDYSAAKSEYEKHYNGNGTSEVVGEVLKVIPNGEGISNFQIQIPATKIPGKPKLALEYKIKPVGISASAPYISPFNQYGIDGISFYNRQIREYLYNGPVIQAYDNGSWYTIKIIYDNVNEEREVYIDGIYMGKYTNNCSADMSYVQTGAFNFNMYLTGTLVNGVVDGTKYYELDYFKLYKYTESNEIAYSAAPSLHYEDFESSQPGILTSIDTGKYGTPYSFKDNQYEIVNESGNKIMRLRQTADSGDGYPLLRITVPQAKFSSASKIILEYKVRLNNSNQYSFLRSREKNTYGTYLPSFYQNKIYDKDYITNSQAPAIGGYSNNEWVTITSVHDIAADVNGKARRETYINGQYAYTSLDDYESGTNTYLNHGGDFRFNFSIRTGKDINEYVDIDYIKIYSEPAAFAPRVPNATAVGTDKIDVEFNNVPKLDDLISKITVTGESGNTTSISRIEFNADNNVGVGYAQKFSLYFDKQLNTDMDYTITFNNITDVNGNTFSGSKDFTTLPPELSVSGFDLMQNGRTYVKGNDFTNLVTADVNIKNNTDEVKKAVLIVGGYLLDNDGIAKMTEVVIKPIDVQVSENIQNFTSDGLDISSLLGESNYYVHAYVWDSIDNMKPLIASLKK